MEENIIINGEILLKKGPQPFKPSGKLDEYISDLEFALSEENPDFRVADILEKLKDLKSQDGELSFGGTDVFWQVFVSGEEITVTACDIVSRTRKYHSFSEMERDFVKLSDFLKRAKFVGREFKRTKSVKEGQSEDMSYMHSYSRFIVLYAMADLFLIKRVDLSTGKEKYDLINSRYTMDGNYSFFGPVYDEYRDTDRVYREILEQIRKENKKKIK